MSGRRLLMLVAICTWIAPAFAQVTFTTISRGQQSGIEESREVVVRTAADWTALWQAHAPGERPPEVDFTRCIVAGVFLGTRSTAGYEVEITSVERGSDALVVLYREDRPPPDAITAQVLTFPYHLVRLDRHDGPVRFRRVE